MMQIATYSHEFAGDRCGSPDHGDPRTSYTAMELGVRWRPPASITSLRRLVTSIGRAVY